ncbi:MAG: hypothetical protein SFY68_07015 [Candidatus Sumerlaeia bacterium]|nr:hypothetical protein [Candidatus Sumerlaeia bacterium]
MASGALVLVIVGVALCLFGWLLYRTVLHVLGGVLGAALGLASGWLLAAALGVDEPWPLLIQVVNAVLGALSMVWLFRFLDKMVFLVFGLVVGVCVMAAVHNGFGPELARMGPNGFAYWGILLAGVLVVGGVFYFLRSWFVVISTTLVGTLLLVMGLATTGWGVLGLLGLPGGLVVQGWSLKRWGKGRKKEKTE